MKNSNVTFTTVVLALAFLALSPIAKAVNPAPDGCYPNYTTAEGCNALSALTAGIGNTGIGWYSLFQNTTGNYNIGVGAGALVLNNADSNTAVGTAALLLNTSGAENTAIGTAALIDNDGGANNTAVGSFALQTNTSGSNNTALGDSALMNNIDGDYITALGAQAGTHSGIVRNNIYIGDPGFGGDENVISIGGIAASGTDYIATYIGGIYGASVNTGTALPVYVDTDGHLGTMLVNGSAKTLRMRSPHGAQPQASLEEFQKQQKRIAELESTVARLVATVKEQAAQIQKVSAQVEMSRPNPQMVNNR